jgi:hypothetical protein
LIGSLDNRSTAAQEAAWDEEAQLREKAPFRFGTTDANLIPFHILPITTTTTPSLITTTSPSPSISSKRHVAFRCAQRPRSEYHIQSHRQSLTTPSHFSTCCCFWIEGRLPLWLTALPGASSEYIKNVKQILYDIPSLQFGGDLIDIITTYTCADAADMVYQPH